MGKNKGIWNLIFTFKFRSIFIKYFISIFLILVIILTSISTLVYAFYFSSVKKDIEAAYESSLHKIKDTIDTIISEGDRISARLLADHEVQNFLNYDNDDLARYESKVVLLDTALKLSMSSSEYIYSIYLYSYKNNYLISSYNETISSFQEFDDNLWLEDLTGNMEGNKKFYFRNEKISPLKSSQNDFLTYIQFIDSTNMLNKGVIVFNTKVKTLQSYIGSLYENNFEDLYIVDQNNTIIFNNNYNLIGTTLPDAKRTAGITDIDGRKSLVSVAASDNKKYNYITVVPLDSETETQFVRDIFLSSVLASIVLSFLLSLTISFNMYRPFRDIIEVFNSPEITKIYGDRNNKKQYSELKFILTKIVDINLNQKNMEASLTEYLAMLKKTQTIALQSQINPHFLYNTLTAINWLAIGLTKSENEASVAITNLAELLRLSLETGNNLTPIRDEMEHARKYIEIEKLRFKNLFQVEWFVDKELENYLIVKITLQPIIENAIYHGLKQKKGGGAIRIKGYLEENNVVFEVEDDGIGISSEALYSINEELNKNYIKEDQHIGIKNVNQRIKLVFGEEYGVKISSELDKGTTVKIIVPKYL
ncbi:sensor histidine kinase [Anaerocolumna sp.]|uniref:sensor histidine kinase n=1 Tax=Anaerocolumna sp. TaxID=2041569 RepID=UPI0028A818E5|nr:histidine kinase [Anaerocolumna sp.]